MDDSVPDKDIRRMTGESYDLTKGKGIIMNIYDISQEVFSCKVYPGDPMPEKKVLNSMEKGELYNLTSLSMCTHNGTHIDAPRHFIKNGKAVDELSLDSLVGMAYVSEHCGVVTFGYGFRRRLSFECRTFKFGRCRWLAVQSCIDR